LTAEQTAHGIEVLERTARRQLVLVEQLAAERAQRRAASGDGESAPAGTVTASAGSDAPPAESVGVVDLGGLRILIVDDDADARESMRMILAPLGAEVATAISAIDAFDVLQQGRPDVLISDIVMPDADGYALLRRVRAPDTGERGVIPAIAVSGSARPGDRQRALGAGYQLHLTKPFDARDLIAAVRTLTGR
jgi:CheY-like chemotaxis protein